jgi:hypothetical protein
MRPDSGARHVTVPAIHRIHPHEGVDDIRFGMTPEEVASVAGPPDGTRHQPILERTVEQRGAVECEYDDDTGRLVAVYVIKPGRGKAIQEQLVGAPYVPAFLDDIEVLDAGGFARLRERERHREGRGGSGVLFPDIGLVVAGFGKRLPEGRYVIAFLRDHVDAYEAWIDV